MVFLSQIINIMTYLIKSWIDFSQCTILHSKSHFIKPDSDQISGNQQNQQLQPPAATAQELQEHSSNLL